MALVRAFRKGFYISLHRPDTPSAEFDHPNPEEISTWAAAVEGSEVKADDVVKPKKAAKASASDLL